MKSLEDLRIAIDRIDDDIVDRLVERFEIVRAVKDLKSRESLDVVQPARVEQVKTRVAGRADEKGLDGQLLRAIYTLIIDHAHRLEQDKS